MGGWVVRKRTRSETETAFEATELPPKKPRVSAKKSAAAARKAAGGALLPPRLKKAKVIEKLEEMKLVVQPDENCLNNSCDEYITEDSEIKLKMPVHPPSPTANKENLPPSCKNNEEKPETPEEKPAIPEENTAKPDEEVDDRETNRRSPNGFLLPDPLPKGERLVDSTKQEWVLGKPIGLGGFGELYLACSKVDNKLSSENYVIKIEPHSNGPLFVEVHFYIRGTKDYQIDQFKRQFNINHLGVPSYISSGTHRRNGKKFRFLVMQRFGSDLQRILDHSEGARFTDKTVLEVGLQVLDSLQYIHAQGYVHKDVKAANLLVGLGVTGQHKVHLVDFGLCSKFKTGSIHKQYVHDERWAHEGTLEYTSRDSHIGCTSRRGDIEVLLYNLIEWWGGSLPWDRDITGPNGVKVAKFRAFANPNKFLRHCFRRVGCSYPPVLNKMMSYVGGLRFEEEPDYSYLRGLLRQQAKASSVLLDGRLDFKLGISNPPIETEAENLQFLKPQPPDSRVSNVFDGLCVSAKSWEARRANMFTKRDEEAMANPTPAMKQVIDRIEKTKAENLNGTPSRRARKKSGCWTYDLERAEHTPAMLEVMRAAQLRKMREELANNPPLQHLNYANKSNLFRDGITDGVSFKTPPCDEEGTDVAKHIHDDDDVIHHPRSAALIPTDLLRVRAFVPTEIITPVLTQCRRTRRMASLDIDPAVEMAESIDAHMLNQAQAPKGNRELMRLQLSGPGGAAAAAIASHQMRTRSANALDDWSAGRSLRSAFKDGVSKLIRQVSDSITGIF